MSTSKLSLKDSNMLSKLIILDNNIDNKLKVTKNHLLKFVLVYIIVIILNFFLLF